MSGADDTKITRALPQMPAAPPDGEVVQRRRADYNRLVRTTRLVGLLLEKVDFKMVPDALGIEPSLLKRSIQPSTRIISSGIEDGMCVANVSWEVNFKFKGKVLLKCKASYIISYDGFENVTNESVETFVDNVARTATYAYFRALYAHMDWSAGLGSQPLPVIQLQPKL